MSGQKKYSNFEEIDKDLKRLYLQSEISKEELKLSLYEVKESVTPSKLFGSVLGGVASSALLIKLLTPVATFGIGKIMARYSGNKIVVKKPWWSTLLSFFNIK